ncbi:Dynein light chain 4, axonemal [Irineochytrium annulatum]|nr:Dynein light chain 4, axonemal [Irineochytrium annulatum]
MADAGSTGNLAAPAAASGAAAGEKAEEKDLRKNFNYPLVKVCDMVDELRVEAIDMVVTAVEKHPGNYEVTNDLGIQMPPKTNMVLQQAAAKTIKELMDKRCGSSWHVVVGEGFGFEVTHEMKNLMFMYFGGNIGILVWKAS